MHRGELGENNGREKTKKNKWWCLLNIMDR